MLKQRSTSLNVYYQLSSMANYCRQMTEKTNDSESGVRTHVHYYCGSHFEKAILSIL